jgi:hypothetical protein
MSLRFRRLEREGLMKRILVALAAVAVVSAVQVGAEERLAAQGSHLVNPDLAQARLLQADAQRQQDLATLDAFLVSPEGRAALSTVGLSDARVRGSLPTLSDSELQDLARRAAALEADPVAGAMSHRQWVWIGVVALAVILIIIIAK